MPSDTQPYDSVRSLQPGCLGLVSGTFAFRSCGRGSAPSRAHNFLAAMWPFIEFSDPIFDITHTVSASARSIALLPGQPLCIPVPEGSIHSLTHCLSF